MLKVDRSALYTFWFRHYSRREFKKHFDKVRVFGSANLQNVNREIPMILYSNHSYWWDGFWSQLCNEAYLNQNLFIIIEYKQLVRYQFFRKLGAFSIVRENPREAIETLNYAVECLLSPSAKPNGLWIFPQGTIESVEKRPLNFFNGTAKIAEKILQKKHSVYLTPFATRIEYLGEQKPELWLSFRAPKILTPESSINPKVLTEEMESEVTSELDLLKERGIAKDVRGGEILVEGSASINKKWDLFREKFFPKRK